jgi:hypothetical protein
MRSDSTVRVDKKCSSTWDPDTVVTDCGPQSANQGFDNVVTQKAK